MLHGPHTPKCSSKAGLQCDCFIAETECETRPLENTDGIGRSMGEAAATGSHPVAVSPTISTVN